MRAIIVGSGSMGQWFAGVTDGWLEPTFVDTDTDRAIRAAERFDGSVADHDEIDSVPLVCTAVPLAETASVLAAVAPMADTAVIDLSGTMSEPIRVMRERATNRERLNLHALFAPENAPGTVAVVTEGAGPIWDELERRLEKAGNAIFETTPEAHDHAMETIQAKAHAAIIAYALAADPVDERFHTPISAELMRLASSVLAGSPQVYSDIQQTFDGAASVARAAEQVASADAETFERLYREGQGAFTDTTASQ